MRALPSCCSPLWALLLVEGRRQSGTGQDLASKEERAVQEAGEGSLLQCVLLEQNGPVLAVQRAPAAAVYRLPWQVTEVQVVVLRWGVQRCSRLATTVPGFQHHVQVQGQ